MIDNPSEIVYDGDQIRFLCSYVDNEATQVPKRKASPALAEEWAKSAVMSTFTESLSDVYSSIAWNAERMQQSILLVKCCNKRLFNIRLPSLSAKPFKSPSQTRLEEERRSLQGELVYHTRILLDSIRMEMLSLAREANGRFRATIIEKRQFATVGTSATIAGPGIAGWGVDDRHVEWSIGVKAFSPDMTAQELFLNVEYVPDSYLENNAHRIGEMSLEFVNALFAGEVDFRVLVRDVGSKQNVDDWMFNPQFEILGREILGSDVDQETFEFKVGDTQGRDNLEDLTLESKLELLGKTFVLNPEKAFRLEAPFRMIDYLLKRVDEIDRKLADMTNADRSPDDIHSIVFRRNFTAAVVIGQAVAIDVCGEAEVPSLFTIRAGTSRSTSLYIEPSEAETIIGSLTKLKDAVNDASEPTGLLRLSELCAITHTAMSGY